MKTQEGLDLFTHLHHYSSSNGVTHCTKVKVIFHFKVKIIFVWADSLQRKLGDVVWEYRVLAWWPFGWEGLCSLCE